MYLWTCTATFPVMQVDHNQTNVSVPPYGHCLHYCWTTLGGQAREKIIKWYKNSRKQSRGLHQLYKLFSFLFNPSSSWFPSRSPDNRHIHAMLSWAQSGNHCNNLISWCEELIFDCLVYRIHPVHQVVHLAPSKNCIISLLL